MLSVVVLVILIVMPQALFVVSKDQYLLFLLRR